MVVSDDSILSYIYLLTKLGYMRGTTYKQMSPAEMILLSLLQHFNKPKMHPSPQNDVVANRLLSSGGAHLAHIPWQAG